MQYSGTRIAKFRMESVAMMVRVFNKRIFKRIHSPMTPVRIEAGSELCFGFVRDVSCYGISTFGLKPLTVGGKYKIEFTLPDLGEPVRCNATVRWNRIHTQSFVSTSRQGLMFEDIDPAAAQRIDDWVNRDLPRVAA